MPAQPQVPAVDNEPAAASACRGDNVPRLPHAGATRAPPPDECYYRWRRGQSARPGRPAAGRRVEGRSPKTHSARHWVNVGMRRLRSSRHGAKARRGDHGHDRATSAARFLPSEREAAFEVLVQNVRSALQPLRSEARIVADAGAPCAARAPNALPASHARDTQPLLVLARGREVECSTPAGRRRG